MTHSEFNHILSSIKALSPSQMRRLRQQLDSELTHQAPQTGRQAARTPAKPTRKGPKRTKATPQQATKPLTSAELDQYMLSIGLISQLPNPAEDVDDDDPEDEPVTIKGEPLSETIIRERR